MAERGRKWLCAGLLLLAIAVTAIFAKLHLADGDPASHATAREARGAAEEAAPKVEAEKAPEPKEPNVAEAPPAEEEVPLGDPNLPRETSIRGRTIDRDRKPVGGAIVEAAFKDWNARPYVFAVAARVRSDDEGFFVLGPLDRRAHSLVARKQGVGVGGAWNQSPGAFVELVLVPGATLKGSVKTRAKLEPVKEATVVYHDWALQQIVRTDAQGAFEFPELPPGIGYWQTGSLLVLADGFRSAHRTPVTLRGGREMTADFLLEPGRTLAGKVTNALTGQPIEGAIVGEGWESFGRGATTDAKGEYSFPDADPKPNLLFSARAKGFLPTERQSDGSGTLDFELNPSLQVRGRVLDPRDRPVAGARVYLHRQQFAEGFQAPVQNQGPEVVTTDAEGAYRFDAVTPGKVVAIAFHGSFAPGESALADVPVGGPAPDKLDVTLRGAMTVLGHVRDLRGEPVPGAYVRAYMDWSEQRAGYKFALNYIWNESPFGYADEQGAFRIAGVLPGKTWLQAQTPNHGWASARTQGVEGQTVEGVVISFGGGRISGVVLTAEGEPVPGVQVQANGPILGSNDENSDSWAAQSDALGRFQIAGLKEGIYNIFAWSQFGNPEPRRGIPSGTENVELRLKGSLLLRGEVTSLALGRPVERFTLQIQPQQDRPEEEGIGSTQWNGEIRSPDGRFEQPVTPGVYVVMVRAAGHAPQFVRNVVVEENRAPDPVFVQLEGGATITGLLRDIEGKPARNFWVRVSRYRAPGENRPVEDQFLNLGDQTDGNGRYFIEGVGPGTYVVQASAGRRGGAAMAQVTVQGSEEVERHLQMLPTGTVVIVVQDEEGKPVQGAYFWFRDPEGNYIGWAGMSDERGFCTSQPMRMGPATVSGWIDEAKPHLPPPDFSVNIESGRTITVTAVARRKADAAPEPGEEDSAEDGGG